MAEAENRELKAENPSLGFFSEPQVRVHRVDILYLFHGNILGKHLWYRQLVIFLLPLGHCSGCAIPDTSVIVQMDNSRGLVMGNINDDAKDQYTDIAKRSWADTESWSYRKASCDGHSQKYLCPTSAKSHASSDFLIWVECDF